MNVIKWQTNGDEGSLVMHAVKDEDGVYAYAYCGLKMRKGMMQQSQRPVLHACMRCDQAIARAGKMKPGGGRVKVQ